MPVPAGATGSAPEVGFLSEAPTTAAPELEAVHPSVLRG